MQALGFNAIRLPFSMKDLWGLKPRVFNWDCAVVSPQTFVKSVTDPAVSFPSSAHIRTCHKPKLDAVCRFM